MSSVLHCILIHTHINMCAHIHTHTFKKKVYRYLYMIYNICIKYTYLWYTIYYMVYLYTSICIKHTIFSSQLHHYPAAPWPESANIYSPPSEWYCSHPPPEMVHLNFKGQSRFYLKRTVCLFACAYSVLVFCGDILSCTR